MLTCNALLVGERCRLSVCNIASVRQTRASETMVRLGTFFVKSAHFSSVVAVCNALAVQIRPQHVTLRVCVLSLITKCPNVPLKFCFCTEHMLLTTSFQKTMPLRGCTLSTRHYRCHQFLFMYP